MALYDAWAASRAKAHDRASRVAVAKPSSSAITRFLPDQQTDRERCADGNERQ